MIMLPCHGIQLYKPNECFPGGSDSEESACNEGELVAVLSQEDPLEKEMATHSSILA